MTRKIVSQTNDHTTAFPSLDLPMVKYLEKDTVIDGVQCFEGDRDFRYPADSDLESILLVTIGNRVYHSVHSDYTNKMLKPTEDNDYVIEKELDGNFTFTVLRYNTGIAYKYANDPVLLNTLGLPDYDEEVHTTDLYVKASIPEEAYIAVAKFEEDKLKKQEEDEELNNNSSQEEIDAFAAKLVEISSGNISVDTEN
jgi:hypothetical protein